MHLQNCAESQISFSFLLPGSNNGSHSFPQPFPGQLATSVDGSFQVEGYVRPIHTSLSKVLATAS